MLFQLREHTKISLTLSEPNDDLCSCENTHATLISLIIFIQLDGFVIVACAVSSDRYSESDWKL